MRILLFLLLLSSQLSFTQNVKFLDSIPLKADTFIGVDEFENYYYTIGNTLYKKSTNKTYSYANTQLGTVSSVDITNPLKILIFYKNFNTIVLLDNRLNEYTNSINLTQTFTKNVAFAGISSVNNLWLFSKDDNTLTLWNYRTGEIIIETNPISFYSKDFNATNFKSNYTNCYVFSDNSMLNFNQYGNFISEIIFDGKNAIPYQNGVIFTQNNQFSFKSDQKTVKIDGILENQTLSKLVLSKNKLYFFNSNMLYRYAFLKK